MLPVSAGIEKVFQKIKETRRTEVDVKYKKYTSEELSALVRQQLRTKEERIVSACGEPVYDKLFAGLDFTLLSLMCVQVRWSMQECGADPFMKVMRLYADKVVALVPVWKKLSIEIAKQGAFFASKVEEARLFSAQNNKERVWAAFEEVKARLKAFDGMHGNMAEAADRQSDLANFIIGELTPAAVDKRRWAKFGLEQCLNNDLFIEGTESSLYNAKTLFSFVSHNISQSIGIIDTAKNESSTAGIFTLSGQAEVWQCISDIAKRLMRGINEFLYAPYPETA